MLPQRPQLERGRGPQEPPPWLGTGQDLERSLWFLQQQHAETLQQLHAEIEHLKRKNKDLHYQLIMHPELQKTDAHSAKHHSPRKLLSKRNLVGKTDSSVKAAAAAAVATATATAAAAAAAAAAAGQQQEAEAEKEKGEDLIDFWSPEEQQVSSEVEKAEDSSAEEEDSTVQKGAKGFGPVQETVPAEAARRRDIEVCDRATSPVFPVSPSHSRTGEVHHHLPTASSNPFLVNVLPSHMRKPPTLEECEVVIRQLWNINHMQMQELTYLRSCLEDIHKTKRIPEEYMLAGQLNHDTRYLPSVKNAPRRWILNPLPAAERAVLPALKQTLGNAFADRQKRTQAVQRNRLHRTAR